MNRIESFLIAAVLVVGVPLLLLTSCWFCLIMVWILEIGGLPESAAIALLVTSVIAGVVIDICCLRKWTKGFYQANMTLMVCLYLICSLLAIGLFMGVPLGNLALGILAGLYVGRRHSHGAREPDVFTDASRRVGLFTGAVVGTVALPVGILALCAGEEYIAVSFVESVGLPYSRITGVGLVVALCLLLMVMQYWLARGGATLAYRGWKKKSPALQG